LRIIQTKLYSQRSLNYPTDRIFEKR